MEQKQSTFQNTGGKKMGKALIIGCGGVASVAIHKCCQNSEAFDGDLHCKPDEVQMRCAERKT